VLVTVTEAARALNIDTEDFVYRLLRTGALKASKVHGRWDVDPASVEERRRRIERKRSSKSHRETEAAEARSRRHAEAAARFA
jgi:hypothetical protein